MQAAQIRAVAFTEYAKKFDRLLQKGQAYTISGGSIRPARKGIPTEHMFEIHFNEVSSVHVLRDHVSGSSTAGKLLVVEYKLVMLVGKNFIVWVHKGCCTVQSVQHTRYTAVNALL